MLEAGEDALLSVLGYRLESGRFVRRGLPRGFDEPLELLRIIGVVRRLGVCAPCRE
jgi:hypothetical protein